MKIKNLLFPVLILSFFLVACGSDDDISKLDPEGDCFTAKIDGETFISDNVTGSDFFFLTIGATSGTTDVPTFGLTLVNSEVGSHAISAESGAEVTGTYSPGALSSSEQFAAISGTLTVLEHDVSEKRIKGTFEFEGDNGQGGTISVTDGEFELGYN